MGFRKIYYAVIGMSLLVCSLISIVVKTNKYMYMIWVFMSYLCLGAHFVIFPNVIISIFGLRSSVQLSSFIYITRCPSALAGVFLSKALVSRYGVSSYSIMFYTSCILICISFVIMLTLFNEEPIRHSNSKQTMTDEDDYVKVIDKEGSSTVGDIEGK